MFLTGKVYNSRWVIERTLRDHAQRINTQLLQERRYPIEGCSCGHGRRCFAGRFDGIGGSSG